MSCVRMDAWGDSGWLEDGGTDVKPDFCDRWRAVQMSLQRNRNRGVDINVEKRARTKCREL